VHTELSQPYNPGHERPFHQVLNNRPLSTRRAAELCGISDRAIRAAASTGRLPGFRQRDTPKLWRFRRTDVERYRDERKGKTRASSTEPLDHEAIR
jgi:excisionase family DNA binding protein